MSTTRLDSPVKLISWKITHTKNHAYKNCPACLDPAYLDLADSGLVVTDRTETVRIDLDRVGAGRCSTFRRCATRLRAALAIA